MPQSWFDRMSEAYNTAAPEQNNEPREQTPQLKAWNTATGAEGQAQDMTWLDAMTRNYDAIAARKDQDSLPSSPVLRGDLGMPDDRAQAISEWRAGNDVAPSGFNKAFDQQARAVINAANAPRGASPDQKFVSDWVRAMIASGEDPVPVAPPTAPINAGKFGMVRGKPVQQNAQDVANAMSAAGNAIDQAPVLGGLKSAAGALAGAGFEAMRQAQIVPRLGGALQQMAEAAPNLTAAALAGMGTAGGGGYMAQPQIEQAIKGAEELKTANLPKPEDLFGEKAIKTWEEKTPGIIQIATGFLDPANELLGLPMKGAAWAVNTRRLSNLSKALGETDDAVRIIEDIKSAGLSSKEASRKIQAAYDFAVRDTRTPEEIANAARKYAETYANVENTTQKAGGFITQAKGTGLKWRPITEQSAGEIVQGVLRSINPLAPTPGAVADAMANRASVILDAVVGANLQKGGKDAAQAVIDLIRNPQVAEQSVGQLAHSKAANELRALLGKFDDRAIANFVADSATSLEARGKLNGILQSQAAKMFPTPQLNPLQKVMNGYKQLASKPFMDWSPAYYLRNYATNVVDGAVKEGVGIIPNVSYQKALREMEAQGIVPSMTAANGLGGAGEAVPQMKQPFGRAAISQANLNPNSVQSKNAIGQAVDTLKQGFLKHSSDAEQTAGTTIWWGVKKQTHSAAMTPGRMLPSDLPQMLVAAGLSEAEYNAVLAALQRNVTYAAFTRDLNAIMPVGKTVDASWTSAVKGILDDLSTRGIMGDQAAEDIYRIMAQPNKSRNQIIAELQVKRTEIAKQAEKAAKLEPVDAQVAKTYDRVVEANLQRAGGYVPKPKDIDLALRTDEPLTAGARARTQAEIDQTIDAANAADRAAHNPETTRGWTSSVAEQPITPEMKATVESAPELRGNMTEPNAPLSKKIAPQAKPLAKEKPTVAPIEAIDTETGQRVTLPAEPKPQTGDNLSKVQRAAVERGETTAEYISARNEAAWKLQPRQEVEYQGRIGVVNGTTVDTQGRIGVHFKDVDRTEFIDPTQLKATSYTTPKPQTLDDVITLAEQRGIAGVKNRAGEVYPLGGQKALINALNTQAPYGVAEFTADNLASRLDEAAKLLENYVPREARTYAEKMARDKFAVQVRNAFKNITDEELQAGLAVTEARAKQWVRENPGKTVEDFYKQTYAAIEKGEASSGALKAAKEARGSTNFVEDGRAIMRAAKSADVSTFMHESAHAWLPSLPQNDLRVIGRAAGLNDVEIATLHKQFIAGEFDLASAPGRQYKQAQEYFASSFEKYLKEGIAPTKELAGVFDRFKEWIANIYRNITGTKLEGELTPEVRDVMRRMLGGDAEQAAKVAPKATLGSSGDKALDAFLKKRGFDPAELPIDWAQWSSADLKRYPITQQVLDYKKTIKGEAKPLAKGAGKAKPVATAATQAKPLSNAASQATIVNEIDKIKLGDTVTWGDGSRQGRIVEFGNGLGVEVKQGSHIRPLEAVTDVRRIGGAPKQTGALHQGAVDPVPPPHPSQTVKPEADYIVAQIDALINELRTKPSGKDIITAEKRANLDGVFGKIGLQQTYAMADATSTAVGNAGRNFALHNYADRRNFDTWISYALPWNYWYTREGFTYALTLARDPKFLTAYNEYQQELDKINGGLPEAYRGKIPLGENTRLFADFGRALIPFETHANTLRNLGRQASGDAPAYQKNFADAFEVSYYPGMEYAASIINEAMGRGKRTAQEQSGSIGIQTAQARLLKGATAAIGQANPDLGIQPGGLNIEAPFTGAIQSVARGLGAKNFNLNSEDYFDTGRIADALTDQLKSGKITKEQYDLALKTQSGDVWDKAKTDASARGFINEATRFGTGIAVREMPQSTMDIEAAKQARANLSEYIKNANPSAEELKQLYANFDKQYPFYAMYAERYAAPEDRAKAFDNPRFMAALNELQQKRDADLAALPIGTSGDAVTRIWDAYNAQAAKLDQQYPNKDYTTTNSTKLAEQETARAIAEMKKTAPRYEDYTNYGDYQNALAQWRANIPQRSMFRGGIPLTAEQVDAYDLANDTPKQALDKAFSDWYHERTNATYQTELGSKGNERIASSLEKRLIEKQAEQKYGDKPTEKELLARVQQIYGDRFNADDLRAQIKQSGILSADERYAIGKDKTALQAGRIFDNISAVPDGYSRQFGAELDAAMNKAGFRGSDFLGDFYRNSGKMDAKTLQAIEDASKQILGKNNWKDKSIADLQKEIKDRQTFDQMKAEIEAATNGLSGKEKVLAQRQIEDKYGRPLYKDTWQPEGEKMVGQGWDELAKVPPGKSDEFWTIVNKEASDALKKAGNKYGIANLSDIWYNTDPATLDDKLPAVIAAMQKASAQLKLTNPSIAALQEWVNAEKQMNEYMAMPKGTGAEKAARREFWNSNPLLAKYYSNEGTSTSASGGKPANMPEDMWALRSRGGGGGATFSKGYTSSYTPKPPTQDAQQQFDGALADVTDNGLRELITTYYRQTGANRDTFMRRNPSLAFWLSQQTPERLAQLEKLAMTLNTPRSTPRYKNTKGNKVVTRVVKRY